MNREGKVKLCAGSAGPDICPTRYLIGSPPSLYQSTPPDENFSFRLVVYRHVCNLPTYMYIIFRESFCNCSVCPLCKGLGVGRQQGKQGYGYVTKQFHSLYKFTFLLTG